MKMNILLGVLVLLCVLLVVLRIYGNRHYFEGFAGSSDMEVTICKAEWCGHCKKAMPEFEKLVAASPISLPNGKKATVKMLDSDANKDELKEFNVRGFPTIFVKANGEQMEYPGDRTMDGVMEFLKSL
jgi:thiol-disulfide isomerase/thioredoxin